MPWISAVMAPLLAVKAPFYIFVASLYDGGSFSAVMSLFTRIIALFLYIMTSFSSIIAPFSGVMASLSGVKAFLGCFGIVSV